MRLPSFFISMFFIEIMFFSGSAFANISMNAYVSGSEVRWRNAMQSGRELTPTSWTVVSGLLPVDRWIPGGTLVAPQEVMVSFGGEQVTIPLKIVGMEYNTVTSGVRVADSGAGTKCTESGYDGALSWVKSQGNLNCLADFAIEFNTPYTPYSFMRPVFEIDDSDLIAAFSGRPSGDYFGTISISSFYEFYFNNVRSRRELPQVVSFNVTHQAEHLVSVTMDDSRQMDLHYRSDTVSGRTTFAGVANGLFSHGLKMSLDPIRSNKYQLHRVGDIPTRVDSGINYNIKCLECDDMDLVVNGDVVTEATLIDAPEGEQTIHFNIVVDFYDQSLVPLESGLYQDNFLLMFELNIL